MNKTTPSNAIKKQETTALANTKPDTDCGSLDDAELDQVSAGLAPNLSSMMKALWKSKGSAEARESGKPPMDTKAYASHGAGTKG